MQTWKLLNEPQETKVGWRKVTQKIFEQPDGKTVEYITYGGVNDQHGAIIALTPDNQVIVAEQFRPGPEMTMQELPGGNIELGEEPRAAVLRELREESGYASDEVEFLGEARKDAYMNATWYFYLARNCQKVSAQSLDEGEFVTVKTISIDELITNAKQGRMSDANAVLMAYDQLMAIKAE